jgi:hypothetical protein
MTLGEAYPIEQARVRKILGYYKEIGPPGLFGAAMIEDLLKRADKAVMEQDITKMILIFEEMKEIKE